MEKEARFIIKEDKYSLLIIQVPDSNKKIKKGISIYKKNLEINELNEDIINIALNKKEKILYSFANLGLYEISGVRCFAYCSEKDIKEVGIISYIKIYQILNISYIILEDMDINTASNLLNHFKEQSKSELNKGFFFAQDIYNMSKGFDVFFHKLYDIIMIIFLILIAINALMLQHLLYKVILFRIKLVVLKKKNFLQI